MNLNPWRYQDQGNDRRWRAPRSQPNMEGEIDRDYYDDAINPRNSLIIDYIHYFVLTQGFYPVIGQALKSGGPLSAEAWAAAGNEGPLPAWFNKITPTDAYAYAALYPQNIIIKSDPSLVKLNSFNPDFLHFSKTPESEARELVFVLNVDDQPATTNTTRLSQYPEGQLNLGRGEDWLSFQRKKKADIECRLEQLADNEENAEDRTDMQARIREIDRLIGEYERNKISDSVKRLSSVRGRLTPEYVRVLFDLYVQPTPEQIEDGSGPPEIDLVQITDSENSADINNETLSTVSQRVNLEMDLIDWWVNLEPSGITSAVYYNPLDSDPASTQLFGVGHYYYIHNTGVSDTRAFDRGLREGDVSIRNNFTTALRTGVEKILQKIGKKTAANISTILGGGQSKASLSTKKSTRPGTPWLYSVKIPLSVLEELPLAVTKGLGGTISAYRAAHRQKRLNDAVQHKVSYKISGLEERMTTVSNTLARYNAKIIMSGATIKGFSFRQESIKIRTVTTLVHRLLSLNNLNSNERDFDAIEILLNADYQPLGFYYNGSLYTKGTGVGSYFILSNEEFENVLGREPDNDPCDIATSTPVTSYGVYNVFAGFIPATYGFILYGQEIYKLAISQRNPMPWSEFVTSYVIPPPKIIPASIENINFSNIEDFLNALDQKLQKTPEDVFQMNSNLTFGPSNLGASPAAILANSQALAINGIGDSLLSCENIPTYAQQISGYLVGAIRQNPTAFHQIGWEKILAMSFRIAMNYVHKAIQDWIADQTQQQREPCPEVLENLSPAIAGQLQQLVQASISQGGRVRPAAALNLASKIVEEQLECLLGGVGSNILLAIQNQPGGPWKEGLLMGYELTSKSMPKVTLQKLSSPGDFMKIWGKKILQLLVAALVQWIIVEIASTIQKAIGCKDPINLDRFEDALQSGDLGELYAEFYGEADLNHVLDDSGIVDFVSIIKEHITNEDSSLPTQIQAREFHDDVSKMTTARELTGLLEGKYSSSDRLVLEIHGMVYTRHNGRVSGESLERGDVVYSTLKITPDNIISYLKALGDNIPKAEIQKAFQPHRPIDDSECVPAGQTHYELLRGAGFSVGEISEQVNENMCAALETLDNFCGRNDPGALESAFGNFIRDAVIETMPEWLTSFLEDILNLKDEARKVSARITTQLGDYDPPGLVDITNDGDNPETRNFKEFGLDYVIDRDHFKIGNLSLEVSEAGEVTIKNTETEQVLVSLRKENNFKFLRAQRPTTREENGNTIRRGQNYTVPAQIWDVLPKNFEGSLRQRMGAQNGLHFEPARRLRTYYFTHMNGGNDPGPIFNSVSHTAPFADLLTSFYRREPGRSRKRLVHEKLIEALMLPNQEDPCLDLATRTRGETALEAIRVRVVNYLLNVAPIMNGYAFGSSMSKVIIVEYLYNEITKDFEQKGILRDILEACRDIAKVFREFDDIRDIPENTEQLRAIVYRLYSESLRKISVTTPMTMTTGDQQDLLTRMSPRLDNNGDPIPNSSPYDRYSNAGNAHSLLYGVLVGLGATPVGNRLAPNSWNLPEGVRRDKFMEQARDLLQYYLPVDAIIALQMIYLDKFYNHIDLAPQLEYSKSKRVELSDIAFKSAIDPQFFPRLSTRFTQLPVIVGDDNYYRISDILNAIKYHLVRADQLITNQRPLFNSIKRTEAQIKIEEREMSWFRGEMSAGVMGTRIFSGRTYHDDIFGPGNPRYAEQIERRATDKAFPYTPHEDYTSGNIDYPKFTGTLLALVSEQLLTSGHYIQNFERGALLEGATTPDLGPGGNLRGLWENRAWAKHKRRDSFGYVLLQYLLSFENPGTELFNAANAAKNHYDNNDRRRDSNEIWDFYRAEGASAPFYSEHRSILQGHKNRADGVAASVLQDINTLETHFESLWQKRNRIREAIIANEILDQDFVISLDLIDRPSKRRELNTELNGEHNKVSQNISNAPRYPALNFNQTTGERSEVEKDSTRYKVKSLKRDMETIFTAIDESLNTLEDLIEAYIVSGD